MKYSLSMSILKPLKYLIHETLNLIFAKFLSLFPQVSNVLVEIGLKVLKNKVVEGVILKGLNQLDHVRVIEVL